MKTILILFLAGLLSASTLQAQDTGVIRQQRSLKNFAGVDVGGAFEVFIEKGSRFSVVVEADEAFIDRIEAYVNDDVLFLETKGWNKKARTLNVYITMPSLREIKATGAADVKVEKGFRSTGFLLQATGAASLNLDMEIRRFEGEISGAVDVRMKGSAESARINASGSSDFKGRTFNVSRARVSLSGSADLSLRVTEEISGSVNGMSELYIWGEPPARAVTTSGLSEVSFF